MNETNDLPKEVLKTKLNVQNWIYFFGLSYFFLYCNSGQFLTSLLFEWIYSLIVPPFAALLGHHDLERVTRTGSGDTPFHYYQVFCMFGMAFISSFFLLFLMRKQKVLDTFIKVVYMLVRYYLIYLMIIYGLAKVFYLQFQYPNDISMERTLGDMSPMGLMWTFMGYSKGYTMFAGWLEFIAGVLLVFRRTTVLGAMMTFGVMLNVFMMNMCYDVPVKLLSFHMTIMSLIVLFPVRREVTRFLFGREKVVRDEIPFFNYGKGDKIMFWLKVSLLAIMLLRMSSNHYPNYKKKNTTSFLRNKQDVISHTVYNDSLGMQDQIEGQKWKSLASVNSKYLAIRLSEDEVIWYNMELDEAQKTLGVKRYYEDDYHVLEYQSDSLDVILLTGKLYSDSVHIHIKKSDKDFLLKTRGFSWMQEQAFNR